MFILHDLWNGLIYPAENNCPTDGQYRTARKHMVEQEDLFWKELSPAGKDAYEAFQDARSNLIWQETQNAFVQGVRLGVQFMLDALSCEREQKRP